MSARAHWFVENKETTDELIEWIKIYLLINYVSFKQVKWGK